MRPGPLLAALAATLRSNLAVVASVVVTASICLALLGAGLLLRAQVRTVDAFLLDQVEVVIDMSDDASAAERDALMADLRADPGVAGVTYEDKRAVYARFLREFRDSPEITSGVSAADLPAAVRVALTDPRRSEDIVLDYGGRDGVEDVRDSRAVLAPLYRVLNGFTAGAFALAAVQGIASLALTYTMIRISAHGRRRETAIMRLVGATDGAIRAPFVLESAFAGLLGGLLAAAVLVAAKVFLIDGAFAHETTFPLLGWPAVWHAAVAVVLAGTLAAAAMSSVALRRHLRV